MIGHEVLNCARNSLKSRLAALDKRPLTEKIQRDFSFAEIREGVDAALIRGWITPLLAKNVDCAAIYRLTVNNQDGASKLRQAFENYVPPKGVVRTRNNKVANSRTVYVGSSRNIRQRLTQHLRDCASGTYALKMHLWCPDAENSLKVEVTVVRGAVNAFLVQDIEDALWTISRPMFGKIGGR